MPDSSTPSPPHTLAHRHSPADEQRQSDATPRVAANSPLGRYQRLCQARTLTFDPAQQQALHALQLCFEALQHSGSRRQVRGLVSNMHEPPSLHAKTRAESCRGLYLWGDVGRGKTMLMDLFHDSLGEIPSLRLHFHHFMARIHRDLNRLCGVRDPLAFLARELARECRVLCFDEFFVTDIGDAIILGRLLETLFEQGVLLVATSNIAIARLYENGLQRERFLPTIALLERRLDAICFNGTEDHRLTPVTAGGAAANTDIPAAWLCRWQGGKQADFDRLFSPAAQCNSRFILHGRPLEALKAEPGLAWFSFNALCLGPRSQLDYMTLAEQLHCLALSDVPRLGGKTKGWIRARGTEDGAEANPTGERTLCYAAEDDAARRFIALVDEFYDRGKLLYLHTDVPLEQLYGSGALSLEFRRTYSRLMQMLRADWPS